MTKCVLSEERIRDFAAEIFDIEQTYPHEYEAIVARIANEGAEAQRKADEDRRFGQPHFGHDQEPPTNAPRSITEWKP